MTQTLSVRCQNCGSSLQIGEGIRYITCGYCHTELQIVRDATIVHTEALERIEQNTQTTVSQLKIIDIQNEIERLDRDWQMWREANLSRDKSGALIEPSPSLASPKVGMQTTLMIGVVLGLVLMAVFWLANGGILMLLGLVAPPFLLFLLRLDAQSSATFHRARDRYRNLRNSLLQQLDQARLGQKS